MKIINATAHGVIDYLMILMFWLAPSLFGLAGTAAALSYVSGWTYLALVVFTAYPLGIISVIPFTAHGAIEFLFAVALTASPWLAGYSGLDSSRNFFLGSGIGTFAVWLLTDYRGTGRPSGRVTIRTQTRYAETPGTKERELVQ